MAFPLAAVEMIKYGHALVWKLMKSRRLARPCTTPGMSIARLAARALSVWQTDLPANTGCYFAA
jgi:hypothetical protein